MILFKNIYSEIFVSAFRDVVSEWSYLFNEKIIDCTIQQYTAGAVRTNLNSKLILEYMVNEPPKLIGVIKLNEEGREFLVFDFNRSYPPHSDLADIIDILIKQTKKGRKYKALWKWVSFLQDFYIESLYSSKKKSKKKSWYDEGQDINPYIPPSLLTPSRRRRAADYLTATPPTSFITTTSGTSFITNISNDPFAVTAPEFEEPNF